MNNSRALKAVLLAGASLCALPSAALAQQQSAQAGAGVEISEIIVTARRVNERLQDLPMNVSAITGESLQKMHVTRFEEIAKLTPGLNLDFGSGGNSGSNALVSLRGVTWKSSSGQVTIPIYVNEVSLNPNWALQSVFDIGQIEVLRGPQGTTRGESSISGAITVTTRKPDMDRISGYVSGLAATRDHYNLQAAVGFPLVENKVAVRIAASLERNRSSDVSSIHSHIPPKDDNRQVRATLRLEPSDNLDITLMYQHQDLRARFYNGVMGTGSLGWTVPGTPPRVLPPNYNGPAITAGQRLAVSDEPTRLHQFSNIFTLQANWRVFEHTLSYVGGFQDLNNLATNSADTYNRLIGFDNHTHLDTNIPPNTHELRIANDPGGRVDYVIGAHMTSVSSQTFFRQEATYNTGAFGGVGVTPNPFYPPTNGAATEYYRLGFLYDILLETYSKSVFGNAVVHVTDDIDLSGGVRYLHINRPGLTVQNLGPFIQLVPCVVPGTTPSQYYPGSCDLNLAAFNPPAQTRYPTVGVSNPVVYNVSASYKFTRDVMAYVTHGTGYKTGLSNIIPVSAPDLIYTRPEKAKSYELGVKSSWMGGRLVANADIFQIDYTGQIFAFPNINHYNITNGTISQSSANYSANANTQVRGVEGEFQYRVTPDFSIAAVLSYVTVKSAGGLVPCNNPAVPLTATNEMNRCQGAKGLDYSQSPKFQMTIAPDYVHPIGEYNLYARSAVKISGKDTNFGDPEPAKAYTLIDASLGVTHPDQGWDVGLFVKNLLNKKTLLQSSVRDPGTGQLGALFGPAGYATTATLRPREFGVTARYSF